MKKIFLSLLAIAALASCVKTEDFYTEENSEIKIKPATSIATKANHLTAIDGTEYPVAEDFDVYGYWKDMPAGSKFTDGETLYLGLGNKAVEFTNKGNYWGGAENTYYWPKNGSLRFAAYSPSSLDMAHTLANDTYTADVEYTANTNETYDILVAPTSPSYTAMTAAENVSVVFEHALAWITVKVVAKDEDAAKAFDIKKVTIDNVITEASLTAEMSKNAKTEDKMTWDLTGTPAAVEVYNGSQTVTLEPTIIETVANGTLVIPQATTALTINYTQNALPGTPALENQKKTVDLVLDKENTPWKAGKHYVYTLVFGLDEILINPDVVDWEDVVVEDIDVDATKVYTVEQLEAALAEGGKIVLQADLETESLTVAKNKTAVLDLNGHKITGSDNKTGSYGLITVSEGSALTIDGPGTLTATAANDRDWNAYSSVLSNGRGTLVVNEGVVIEHFGGTDMAYGIDNLTNGKGTKAITIINGATVKSPYRAVRQFLNGTEAQNELYVNAGSQIIGTNKSIWVQDPSKNANTGKLVVAEGAELEGDVYLTVTAGSTEWPVEVSVAASSIKDGYTVQTSDAIEAVNNNGVWTAKLVMVEKDGKLTVYSAAALSKIAEKFNSGEDYTDNDIVLGADIDLAATSARSVASNWTPIGSSEKPFCGTFDGNGYSIKNLALVEAEAKEGKAYIGFFSYAKDATIKNVTFENVYINIPCLDIDHSQGHIGAVAGSLEGTSTIENVTVKGDIKVEATTTANGASRVAVVAGGNSYGNVTMKNVHVVANEGSYLKANNNVGALAGQLQGKSVFENCSSNIDVTGTKFFAGGLIGLAAGDQLFTNCHTTGDVTITAGRAGRAHDHYRVGGIAGGWADGATKVCTLTNCSYTGELSGTNADGSVAEKFDYLGYVGRGYTLNNCQGSKVVIDGVSFVQKGNTAAEAGVYDVTGENGEKVVLISTAEELNKLSVKDALVILGADIDFQGAAMTKPIELWGNSTFDGRGHKILNVKTAVQGGYATSLFRGDANPGNKVVKNLVVENLTTPSGYSFASAIWSDLQGANIEIDNVIINNSTIEAAGTVGGFVGFVSASTTSVVIKNSSINNSNLNGGEADHKRGAVVGRAYGCTVTCEDVVVNNVKINDAAATTSTLVGDKGYTGTVSVK